MAVWAISISTGAGCPLMQVTERLTKMLSGMGVIGNVYSHWNIGGCRVTLQVYKIKRGVDGPNLSSQNRSLELAGRLKVKKAYSR